MFRIPKNFYSLLNEMTMKDIKARYKHAFLGFFWVVLTPLLQMFIIATIFSYFIKTPVENYYVFLLSGLLFWNFFSLTLTKSSSSIIDQRALIQKAKFSRIVIPTSVVLANFFHFLISVLLLYVWVILFGKISILSSLLMVFSLLWSLIITLGLSLLVCAFNVRFRDISYFLQIILQVLFYATPILYPVAFIPKKLQYLFNLSPLAQITQMIQSAFTNSLVLQPKILIINFILSLVVLYLGYLIFTKQSTTFDDWV